MIKIDRRVFLGATGLGVAAAGCAALDKRGWMSMIGEAKGMAARPLPPINKDGAGADQEFVKEFIADFVKNDPSNSLEGEHAGEPIFKTSLTGFVPGDDPLFNEYKKIIGPFHHTPEEILMSAAHHQVVICPPAAEIGVVSFILPLADAIVEENAKQKRWCGKRWAQGRLLGELSGQKLAYGLVETLAERGVLAVAPDLLPDFRKQRYPGVGWASPWSHRHVAFAAGMGSFGMNDFFISEMGSAHRCGSVVFAMPVTRERERPEHYRAHCLHHREGGCLECARRCPAKAIGDDGHDKDKCSMNVLSTVSHNQLVNNVNIYGCGLCACGTPCSQGIPA